jgi:2-octaprenylphenol hydroxylase
MKKYDIIINGAGMVGAITALLLADQGRSVALIETQLATEMPDIAHRNLRVSAISKRNLDLLTSLELGQYWSSDRIGRYRNMVVWDNHSTGEIEFNSEGNQELGAMIENDLIVAAAQQQLARHTQVDVYYKTQIESFENNNRNVTVQLNNDTLQCHLLLGADGANSVVRNKLGITRQEKPYQQFGLVAYLQIENAPKETALQAFNSGGPVGLLPMNGGLFSMVWSLPDDQVNYWLKADEARFINGLQAHINRDFGDIKLMSERQAFPLKKTQVNAFYQNRVALLGDAAHTIHPLAGQGVNLGFDDAACLVAKLKGIHLRDCEDLALALKKYQRVRMAEVHKTSETMDVLHHLFTNDAAPIKKIRALGMKSLNQIPTLKNWLLKQAGS